MALFEVFFGVDTLKQTNTTGTGINACIESDL